MNDNNTSKTSDKNKTTTNNTTNNTTIHNQSNNTNIHNQLQPISTTIGDVDLNPFAASPGLLISSQ